MLISQLQNIYELIMKNKLIISALSQVWEDSNIYAGQRRCLLTPSFHLASGAEDGALRVLAPSSLGNALLRASVISLACSQSSHLPAAGDTAGSCSTGREGAEQAPPQRRALLSA